MLVMFIGAEVLCYLEPDVTGSGLCAQLCSLSVALLHYYKQMAFEFIFFYKRL